MTQLFSELTPERVLSAIETAGTRATGYCFALNSLENRVYEVELEDGRRQVLKFYRPGRWSREAILDEHRFLADLGEAEIPAVGPVDLGAGETLGEIQGIFYAAFPKVRGRSPDELGPQELKQLGRLLARMHNVGARRPADHRQPLTPDAYGAASLDALSGTQWIALEVRSRYLAAANAILKTARAAWSGVALLRIHGDCHFGNLLWNQEGPFFVDFDDMVMGPAVQDVFMLARGPHDEARAQRELILEGYAEMRAFDRGEQKLCELLRALRIIHYSAWIASHWKDAAFPRAFPDFPSFDYWSRETEELERIAAGHDA